MGVRVLRKDDIEFAAALTVEEGWYYTPRELETMLKLDPEGSFIFEDGERLGFATTVTYGKTGVLGHLVVGKKGRGRKIGGSLLKAAMDYVDGRGADSMLLYATHEAIKMYQKYGFALRDEIYCVHLNLKREQMNNASSQCAQMKRQDLKGVCEMDKEMFGDDRRPLLEVLYEECAGHAFKIERDGQIAGYAMARHDHVGFDFGPWACTTGDSKDAEDLFWTTLSSMEEGTIYMGSFFKNSEALKIVEKVPKIRSWRIPLMIRGKERYSSDKAGLFGIAAFELG